MGKAPNGLGQFSGKVGGVVFAVSNGEQIVRAYQPVVSNPKSSAQMAQRAKGNLVGRISSFVPKSVLSGLGSNNRVRRAEFLRILLKAATTTLSTSGGTSNYNAKIDDEDVVFSKGAVADLFIVQSTTATQQGVSVSITNSALVDPALYAAYMCRLVAMVYDSTSQELVEVVTKIAAKPDLGTTVATTIPISHVGGYDVVVYGIPMSTDDGSSVAISTDMAMKDDDTISALLSANRNAVVFNYGHSKIFGQANFTPSQAKEESEPVRKKK